MQSLHLVKGHNNYQLFDSNRYWNRTDFPNSSGALQREFGGRTKSWVEAVVGMKMELFKNLYLGGSIRMGFLLSNPFPDDAIFPDLFIPGFNKVTDNSKFGVGYNYSISYLIPLYKKAKKIEEAPVIKEEQ